MSQQLCCFITIIIMLENLFSLVSGSRSECWEGNNGAARIRKRKWPTLRFYSKESLWVVDAFLTSPKGKTGYAHGSHFFQFYMSALCCLASHLCSTLPGAAEGEEGGHSHLMIAMIPRKGTEMVQV